MELGRFLKTPPAWAREPCLYIVRLAAEKNQVCRCGASGTQLFAGADSAYTSRNTGLVARMNTYYNSWLPFEGRIHAALRIRKQQIAVTDKHRVENGYNVDKGNYTLVMHREKEFHKEMEDYRWNSDLKNELFTGPVDRLIRAMRKVKGESLYLFGPDSIEEDPTYRGGRRSKDWVIETGRRVVRVRMPKKDVETLRTGEGVPNLLRTVRRSERIFQLANSGLQ